MGPTAMDPAAAAPMGPTTVVQHLLPINPRITAMEEVEEEVVVVEEPRVAASMVPVVNPVPPLVSMRH